MMRMRFTQEVLLRTCSARDIAEGVSRKRMCVATAISSLLHFGSQTNTCKGFT